MNQSLKLGVIAIGAGLQSIRGKSAAKKYLLEQISSIPGIPAKLAQLFDHEKATGDCAPPNPISLQKIKESIKSSNQTLATQIASIEADAKPASLGQVHRATLSDGRIVAIKVLYENVREDLEQQIRLSLFGLKKSPAAKFGLDVNRYNSFLSRSLMTETDYLKEAKNQKMFYEIFANDNKIVIPNVWTDLSNSNVLVQEYVDSLDIRCLNNASSIKRKNLAETIFEFFIRQILLHETIHADLHGKNIGVSCDDDQKLVVYDYGSILTLPKGTSSMLKALFTQRLSTRSAEHFFELMGFDINKIGEFRSKLAPVLAIFLEPFVSDSWNPEKWQGKEQLKRLLGPDGWTFRAAGPPEFLYLMRAFLYLQTLIQDLKTTIDGRRITESVLEASINTEKPGKEYSCRNVVSKTLRVQVTENDQIVVSIDLPTSAITNIENLMPDSAKDIAIANGIDFNQVKSSAAESGYSPKILVDFTHLTRTYKIWLD